MEENACPERGLPLHLRPGIRGCLAVIAVGLVLVPFRAIHLPKKGTSREKNVHRIGLWDVEAAQPAAAADR